MLKLMKRTYVNILLVSLFRIDAKEQDENIIYSSKMHIATQGLLSIHPGMLGAN